MCTTAAYDPLDASPQSLLRHDVQLRRYALFTSPNLMIRRSHGFCVTFADDPRRKITLIIRHWEPILIRGPYPYPTPCNPESDRYKAMRVEGGYGMKRVEGVPLRDLVQPTF